jgi:hypothetical protein
MVMPHVNSDTCHLKKWLISAQRHQMLSSCPFLKSPSSRIKKGPGHEFRFCHMVALEAFVAFYPQSKNRQDVIEKSANHTAEFAVGVCWY